MTVVWTADAEEDRADILYFIAADDPTAAARVEALFNDAAARLAAHPWLGRTGLIPGTRELIPHESYRLVYETDGQTVWVLAVVHAARQWPPARG